MSTPVEVLRSTATTVFSSAVTAAGTSTDPLADGDRAQALCLARDAYPKLGTAEDGPGPRIDLMAVAFLQNRVGDVTLLERGGQRRGWGHSYALGTAPHLQHKRVGQGEIASAINPAALELGPPERPALERIATALDLELPAGPPTRRLRTWWRTRSAASTARPGCRPACATSRCRGMRSIS